VKVSDSVEERETVCAGGREVKIGDPRRRAEVEVQMRIIVVRGWREKGGGECSVEVVQS
jgi:hypothetical protein